MCSTQWRNKTISLRCTHMVVGRHGRPSTKAWPFEWDSHKVIPLHSTLCSNFPSRPKIERNISREFVHSVLLYIPISGASKPQQQQKTHHARTYVCLIPYVFPYGIRLNLFDFIKVVNNNDPVFVGSRPLRQVQAVLSARNCIVLESTCEKNQL